MRHAYIEMGPTSGALNSGTLLYMD